MINLEMLPRLTPDVFVDTIKEALEEVERRHAMPAAPDALTRYTKSPYGGYQVYSVSRTRGCPNRSWRLRWLP